MPTISLNDVEGAIHVAWHLWSQGKYKFFPYKLDSGQEVNIILNKIGNMLNYGFPNIFIMDKSDIPALKTWWENHESLLNNVEGELKPRQEKAPGIYGVNAYYSETFLPYDKRMTFNFHVPTT